MSLHAARMVGAAFQLGSEIARTYVRTWELTLGAMLRMQRLARVAIETAPIQEAALRGLRSLPSALGWLIAKTRVELPLPVREAVNKALLQP
jgi:hypothetical protein